MCALLYQVSLSLAQEDGLLSSLSNCRTSFQKVAFIALEFEMGSLNMTAQGCLCDGKPAIHLSKYKCSLNQLYCCVIDDTPWFRDWGKWWLTSWCFSALNSADALEKGSSGKLLGLSSSFMFLVLSLPIIVPLAAWDCTAWGGRGSGIESCTSSIIASPISPSECSSQKWLACSFLSFSRFFLAWREPGKLQLPVLEADLLKVGRSQEDVAKLQQQDVMPDPGKFLNSSMSRICLLWLRILRCSQVKPMTCMRTGKSSPMTQLPIKLASLIPTCRFCKVYSKHVNLVESWAELVLQVASCITLQTNSTHLLFFFGIFTKIIWLAVPLIGQQRLKDPGLFHTWSPSKLVQSWSI